MRFGVGHVVTTLPANFVVLLAVSALLDGQMKGPAAMRWPQSAAWPDALQVGQLVERGRVDTGLVAALGLALAPRALLAFARLGSEIRAIGANARAARFAACRWLRRR